MIVDIHTHTFPASIAASAVKKLRSAAHIHPFTDGTAEDLASHAAAAGVDYSVILPVATNPGQVPRINDASARINDASRKTGLLSFGCMHPDLPNWREELDRVAGLGLRGIKLHPVYQGVDFDDVRYLRILDRAGELGLLVLIHAGLDVGFPGVDRVSPEKIRRAIDATGPVTLILAHMGGWRQWDAVEQLLPDTGAYLDTSFSLGRMTPDESGWYKTEADLALLSEEDFLRLIRAFGCRRILFGTDSPWGEQSAALRALRSLPLTEEELGDICGENARRLLRLPEREMA